MDSTPLLQVQDLAVEFPTSRGPLRAVGGISFAIDAGERVAVVGESGSGKSITAASIVGLVPPPGRIVAGSVRLEGRELVGCSDRELASVRGSEIGLILQNPQTALDPLKTIGSQVAEPLRLHRGLSRRERDAQVLELIRRVRIGDPEQRVKQYGHQMSGGMAQRALIASVIGPQPRLLIADEPTSALDATTAEGVLDLISELARDHGMAVMLITHDLGVVAKFAERVIVMYAGRIVEQAPADELFANPRHPYTRGLLDSVPGARGRRAVMAIPGGVPDPTDLPAGCAFASRCIHVQDVCRVERPEPIGEPHISACHFADELAGALARPGGASALPPDEAPRDVHDDTAELLVVEGLSKSFAVGGGPFRKSGSVHAVDDISFSLRKGEVLALVGESGSGKSTTARVLLGLEQASGGSLRFDGDDITDPRTRTVLQRRRIQVVFQNPDASLDPRMTVAEIVAEPLVVHGIGDPAARRARAAELMERVGLSPDVLTRYPHEFSGGQRQRIAIARALAPSPDLVVCDEPVTALDVSVQAQILNLLQDVQRDEGLAYLFIAHDLSVVRQLADRVAVMYLGEIVELAPADGFFAGPRHPYSKALLSAMPAPDPLAERRRERITISGTVPSPLDPPPGCRFHTRCWKAQAVCRESVPPLREHAAGGVAACHFPEPAADVAAVARMPLPAAVAATPEEDHHRV